MRFFLMVMLCTFSFSSWSHSNSEDMLKIMNDAGVRPWGRKQWQEASLNCRLTRTGHKELKCVLRAAGLLEAVDLVKEFSGEDAKFISDLLKKFEVYPYGKHAKQEADVQCYLKNRKISDKKECHVVDYDTIVIP